ncbi:putative pyridoxine 5'-phosphate oxidase superfamily flavin-nucleotide-binding protein [Kitasatospora sp. MAP12-15]|uniref:pyridoxamine 5'-phosphate oxidase family protein n=1 Tax=unclassified Kitasatospora TaxID=2633591 RepID=UPI002476044D|nr:pyridoxamine 5'-phosphate oxidase family protein [Kitasatospora sp. MAP12-44]MDH6113851.1 putative pyridoxine 5'-phosphate oxidase superfamily flavin-nucleotide-binding protein [Kitasatospora sp. MAP12-44]
MTDPYHRGEHEVQRRAGRLPRSGPSARVGGGPRIPEIAAAFLAAQPMLVLGAADAEDRLWATLLTGTPGFLHADGPAAVRIAARPLPGDPLHAAFALALASAEPTEVGMIAIEPASRRRMRMNGRATATGTDAGTGTGTGAGERGLRVALDQIYSNCPKYIQKRGYRFSQAHPLPATNGSELTTAQQELIRSADTFFIATADSEGHTDASHRGGLPGFVAVPAPDRLVWPDYPGNAMFNTLGNLAVHPAAGLLFVDWRTGTTLQLTGTARTDWDEQRAAAVPGAERLVEFTVTAVVETPGASPLRWDEPEFSRFNPPAAA